MAANGQGKLEAKGEMPILGWHGIPYSEASVERYRELKDAGFTHHLSSAPDVAAQIEMFDMAAEAGIREIAACPELHSDPEKTVKRLMDHPALAGYFLRDEPSRADFAELGAWAKRIRATDDGHFCYLNLFPNYAPNEVLRTDSYREYVHLFDQEVPLQLLSFDHYPIVGETEIRPEWYENLEIFSDEAKKAGKPFWAFALATAHVPYPVPTMAALRLQVYSNLAYGAQGIQYFTYWTPAINPNWDFHTGPIGLDGKRTEVYDKVKAMNAEIKNLTGVFLGSEVVSVAHTGQFVPRGTKRLASLPEPFEVLQTTGTGAVVSQLRNGDRSFLVIVNRDFNEPMGLTVACDDSVKRILKDGSIVPAGAYTPTLEVEPGDAVIYMW